MVATQPRRWVVSGVRSDLLLSRLGAHLPGKRVAVKWVVYLAAGAMIAALFYALYVGLELTR